MSLTVGELFVNLGIKGNEKTVAGITKVKEGLQQTASASLEAKVAIVGAMYALERLFAASGAMGTNLTNFVAATGLSDKKLQEWQYAARHAGVANEEFTGSLKSVQTAMSNMLLGHGAPAYYALVANKVGLEEKKAKDTFYIMEQLQKFAQKMPADIGGIAAKSFGVSEGVFAAMRRGLFNRENFAKAPTYSEKEFHALDRANIAWSDLGTKIQMAIGHFNAKHGGQIVKDISMVTDSVLKLITAFQRLAETMKVFKYIGKAFEGWASIFNMMSNASDNLNSKKNPKGGAAQNESISEGLGLAFKGLMETILDKITPSGIPEISEDKFKLKPWVPQNAVPPTANTQNVHVHQNLNFQHDGKDHKRTGESVKKANQDAFRQFNNGQAS